MSDSISGITDYSYLGWLSPEGELICCNAYDHVSKAESIVEELGIDTHLVAHKDELLLRKGWAKISLSWYGDHGYNILWYKFLTGKQKAVIKPYIDGERGLKVTMTTVIAWNIDYRLENDITSSVR